MSTPASSSERLNPIVHVRVAPVEASTAGAASKVNVTAFDPAKKPGVAALVARMTQLPAASDVIAPDVGFTEHPVVPALLTEYVTAPLSEPVASAFGVSDPN